MTDSLPDRRSLTSIDLAAPLDVISADVIASDGRHLSYRNERLLTPEDVARVLQIGRTKVYELLAYGDLRSVKIGKSRRIRRSDLDEFILNLTTESNGR